MPQPTTLDRTPFDWIEVNGVSLRYSIEGAGDPIILIHEMGGCIESWDAISTQLAITNTVLRYDQRAAGQSEKPPQPFTIDDLAADLEALIAALDIPTPVHLVGSAVGAAQALRYAASYPDTVASVALLAPAADISDPSRIVLESRSQQAVAGGMRSILSASLDRAWPVDRRPDSNFFRAFRGRYLANDPHAFARHNHALAAISLGDSVSKVACPALVIAGRHDRVRPPEQLRAFADELPSATFTIVDSAHFIAAEAPGEVLAELAAFYARIGKRQDESPRHVDIPDHALTAEQASALAEATRGTRGRVPAPMRAWLASPEFARRAQSLGETLRYHTSLEPRLSELAILATARFWRSDYEWRVHSTAAAQAGTTAAVIESIRLGIIPDLAATDERVVLDVAAAVHRDHRLSDEFFERATAVLGREGLAELIGILGYYTLVSMTLNVYQIDTPNAGGSPFALGAGREDAHAQL